jgi:putative DNA-invertase from lambdoid prophage Rac
LAYRQEVVQNSRISHGHQDSLEGSEGAGRNLKRQVGQRPKSGRLAPKVIALADEGRSYRWIAHDLSISKTTVADIIHRARVLGALS